MKKSLLRRRWCETTCRRLKPERLRLELRKEGEKLELAVQVRWDANIFHGRGSMKEDKMPRKTLLDKVLRNQPYPCFKLISLPEGLNRQLRKGMLCLYNIDNRTFEFPLVGRIGPAEELFSYLDFVGYFSVEEFRDLVFAGRLPVTCPSCKGPATDAGMISFEVEESGTAEVEYVNGDAEIFICDLCGRHFALMPSE